MRRKKLLAMALGVICGLLLLPGCETTDANAIIEETLLQLTYGDTFGGFAMTTPEGETTEALPQDGRYTFAAYLSDTCGSCIDVLETLHRLSSVFASDSLRFLYLWQDRIPTKVLEKYSIPADDCVALDGKTKLYASVPCYYIVSPEHEVVYSNPDLERVVEKLFSLELVPQQQLVENANGYIKTTLLAQNTNPSQLVYFSMEGCPDCVAADEIVDGEAISSAYEVTRVYKFNDTGEGRVKDSCRIFAQAYGVQWFPSFLLLEGDSYRFVGELPLEQLEAELLKGV